jgi:hypothetical protein
MFASFFEKKKSAKIQDQEMQFEADCHAWFPTLKKKNTGSGMQLYDAYIQFKSERKR